MRRAETRNATVPQVKQVKFRIRTDDYADEGINYGDCIEAIESPVIAKKLMVVSRGRRFWLGIVSIVDCTRLKVRYKRNECILDGAEYKTYKIRRIIPQALSSLVMSIFT